MFAGTPSYINKRAVGSVEPEVSLSTSAQVSVAPSVSVLAGSSSSSIPSMSSNDWSDPDPVVSIPVSTTAPTVPCPSSATIATSVFTTTAPPTVTTSVSTPSPASVRKLAKSGPVIKTKAQVVPDEECCGEGNRVITFASLSHFACQVHCPACKRKHLTVTEGVRRGSVTKILVLCPCGWEHVISDPYTKVSTGSLYLVVG